MCGKDSHTLLWINGECMSSWGRLKTIGHVVIIIGLFRFAFVTYFHFVDLKKAYMLFSLTNAPYSYLSETDGLCNISNLAPYYTAWFHFMPVLLYFHAYDLKEKINLIYFVKIFKGMCQSFEAISLVFMRIIVLFFPFLLLQLFQWYLTNNLSYKCV